MTHFKNLLVLSLQLLFVASLSAQNFTQNIRGTIVDKVSQTPLPGANLVILNTDPLIGSTTDVDGNFRLQNIPIGTYTIRVSFTGYKEFFIQNLRVNSGKEVVLSIALEEDITQMEEIIVRASDTEKNKPINDMAVVSARTFSVEETQKYAAAVNDPARMVASYAGVVQTNDGNNNISIRGNSPFGLLWRMEGVDIPNPNHFAGVASSGGGISILSSQLLTNSDFMTGAFPAEYGNALSGVFDLNLRKGNNENREYTFQAGFLGVDFAAEGPFSKNYNGSYLINYRYSTLSVLDMIGVPIGDAVTNFQDLSFNFYLPTKKAGMFSVFGFGGLSDQQSDAVRDSLEWTSEYDKSDWVYRSNRGAAGVKHSITLNPNTYLQSAVVASTTGNGYEEEKLDDDYNPIPRYYQDYKIGKILISSVINNKINAKSHLRSGVYFNTINYNLKERHRDDETDQMVTHINSSGNAQTIQFFSQLNYRFTEKFTMNAGLHYLQLLYNNTYSLEPRASIRYEVSDIQAFSVGYGLHSQIQPIGVYFVEEQLPDNSIVLPNKNLDLTKAHHFVLGYDRALNKNLRIKTEVYYQHLFNIPISPDPESTLALINEEYGYVTEPLVNEGIGRNYGLELTLEQFLHRNFYFLLSSSVYDSKYRAADQVWRNTRYNGNYAFSFTSGKEFLKIKKSKQRTFGVNIKALYAGSLRDTPIDYDASVAEGETVYIEKEAYSERLPDYFRTDLRFSWKINKKKTTSTFALDIQNVTNNKNVFGQFFDAETGKIKTEYQTPLIPVFSYKIEF